MHSFSFLSLVVLHHLVIFVRGDTSLFIPGFDPQPLSVGNLGTDGQGRTTWEIVPGSLTGTFDEPAFVGTATLVEGPNDAHLIYDNAQLSMSLDIQCGINNGIAGCTANAGYDVTPLVFPTQTAEPFLVQGGGPLQAKPAQTPTSSGFITSSATSSLTKSTTSPSSTVSNDARSHSVVAITLVIGFGVISLSGMYHVI